MENYTSHAERVEPMIHFLIELYRKWEKDSETEWGCQKKSEKTVKLVVLKIRLTEIKLKPFLKWSLLHICAPPLPAWRSYDSHLKENDCTSHASRMQNCSDSLPDETYRNWG